ncbi:MAG TPA: O-antigen ligase family protein [Anaerolineae bacterium]|nr:O-antigen ligase family protein [Anaerolineae bacterium]HQH38108.1 O-antigen ligase family protein [Anaerolineae bacterium]
MDRILSLSRSQHNDLPPWAIPAVLALAGAGWGLLLARFSLWNGLLFTALAFIFVSSVGEPLAGVVAVLFLGPLQAWLSMEFPRIPATIGRIVFWVVVGIWIARGLLRRDWHIPLPPLLIPLLGFMGVTLLSLWQPFDPWTGLLEWGKWGQIVIMFLLVYDRLRGADGSRRAILLVVGLAGVAVFQALVGLWQFGFSEDVPESFAIDARFYRAYGTFEQPNPYAGFLGLVGALLAGIVLAWGWDWLTNGAWRIKNDASRTSHDVPCTTGHVLRFTPDKGVFLLALLALLVTVAALVASWSRGGWMGFAAALLGIIVGLPRRTRWGVALVIVVVVGGLGLYAVDLLPASIEARLTGFLEYTRFEDVRGVGINDANYAVIERMAHWQAALSMWREHFWLGVGFGCYEPAYATYRLINWPLALGHAHNYYLNLLAETGILGLAAFLVMLGSVMVNLWRASRRRTGWIRGLALGLNGAWIHFAVHNLVDNILVNNVHLHFGVLLALSAWVVWGARECKEAA